MPYRAHRGLGDIRRPTGDVFQHDRADPLTAGLDQVLRTVRDLDVAVRVNRRNLAGLQPTLGIVRSGVIAFGPVITAAHPVALGQQLSLALAIPRQLAAIAAADLQVDAVEGAALLEPAPQPRLCIQACARRLGVL
jgi:hypothetical protein